MFEFVLFADLPIWNYDGSSTYQAKGSNSDMYLYPVALFRDPFRRGKNKLVLCEVYDSNKDPAGKISARKQVDQISQTHPQAGGGYSKLFFIRSVSP